MKELWHLPFTTVLSNLSSQPSSSCFTIWMHKKQVGKVLEDILYTFWMFCILSSLASSYLWSANSNFCFLQLSRLSFIAIFCLDHTALHFMLKDDLMNPRWICGSLSKILFFQKPYSCRGCPISANASVNTVFGF